MSNLIMTRWLTILTLAFMFALLTYVGPADYADALSVEADMKLLRVQVAGRGEQHVIVPTETLPERIFPLTHPLSCEGIWIKKCTDFGPCETTCLKAL